MNMSFWEKIFGKKSAVKSEPVSDFQSMDSTSVKTTTMETAEAQSVPEELENEDGTENSEEEIVDEVEAGDAGMESDTGEDSSSDD